MSMHRSGKSETPKTRIGVLALAVAALLPLGTAAVLSLGTPSAPAEVVGRGGPTAESLLGTEVHLPVHMNARVDRWVRRFMGPERASFEQYLIREGLYGGMIRDRLRARGMPEQLLYLAMIESGFSTVAVSPSFSVGVWQFLGATARHFGLTVDEWVDERRDPVRATDAALDYLESLHAEFGSWFLAAAAYNAGPLRVHEALAARKIRGRPDPEGAEDLYWQIIESLPPETRHYVPKMLAAALLAEQPHHFGFSVEPELPYLFDQVLVPAGTPLSRVARASDISPAVLRELNPHLIQGMTPPGRSFLVRVPVGDGHRVLASLPPSS